MPKKKKKGKGTKPGAPPGGASKQGGAPPPPQGPPGGGGQKGGAGAAPPGGAGAAPPGGGGGAGGGAAPGPFNFGDFLNAQFGVGSPFGMRGNYSDPNNPIYAAATKNLQQQLAGTRARYAGSGLGQSSRAALAEGEALGRYGAELAGIGEQAFQSDAARALQAALGGQQLGLQRNEALSRMGAALTGIGQGEQGIPNLGELGSLLGMFASTFGAGKGKQSQTQTGKLGF